MKTPAKKIIWASAGWLDRDGSYTPENLREMADAMEDKEVSRVTIEVELEDDYYGQKNIIFKCLEQRLETDQELKIRLEKERAHKLQMRDYSNQLRKVRKKNGND